VCLSVSVGNLSHANARQNGFQLEYKAWLPEQKL
jgi:hypothetical protein